MADAQGKSRLGRDQPGASGQARGGELSFQTESRVRPSRLAAGPGGPSDDDLHLEIQGRHDAEASVANAFSAGRDAAAIPAASETPAGRIRPPRETLMLIVAAHRRFAG